MSALDTYAEVVSASVDMGMDREPIASKAGGGDGLDHIIDIREYDVPYTIRVAIDKGKYRSTFCTTEFLEVVFPLLYTDIFTLSPFIKTSASDYGILSM